VPLVLLEEPLGEDELEPLVLGLDDVVLSVEVELELDPDVDGVDGAVVVDGAVLDGGVAGEADGVRSAGRSVTRSVRDSLQAVSRPALSATAMVAVSILFISRTLLLVGLRDPEAENCNGCAAGAPLDTVRANHYECGVIRPDAKEMRA